ncbi:MAG TPA: LysM peptidoglycan-binding domain-containing protein [Chitinophagaceae bacterium]|nr:LysM peptidoglycan-binding domain-containing protein [Chitinophagaceae bacterium]
MKKIFCIVLTFFILNQSFAQNKILVQGSYPNLYLQHKVAHGETMYSISKLYNFSSAQLATQNGMTENDILSTDKILKINLGKNNFTQDGQSGENETLIPLYHIVKPGETLFRICQNFGKIRIDFIRGWNDLVNDIIKPEQKIIIGHLRVDLKKASIVTERIINTDAQETATAIDQTEPPKKDETETTTSTTPKQEEEEPVVEPVTNGNDDEGFFVTSYSVNSDNSVSTTGEAATFKSTSGWTNREYYVLCNDIPTGTIVRITANNNRSICAKVLGALPEMKENKNLIIRISNAGAAVLKITEKRFNVKITYNK